MQQQLAKYGLFLGGAIILLGALKAVFSFARSAPSVKKFLGFSTTNGNQSSSVVDPGVSNNAKPSESHSLEKNNSSLNNNPLPPVHETPQPRTNHIVEHDQSPRSESESENIVRTSGDSGAVSAEDTKAENGGGADVTNGKNLDMPQAAASRQDAQNENATHTRSGELLAEASTSKGEASSQPDWDSKPVAKAAPGVASKKLPVPTTLDPKEPHPTLDFLATGDSGKEATQPLEAVGMSAESPVETKITSNKSTNRPITEGIGKDEGAAEEAKAEDHGKKEISEAKGAESRLSMLREMAKAYVQQTFAEEDRQERLDFLVGHRNPFRSEINQMKEDGGDALDFSWEKMRILEGREACFQDMHAIALAIALQEEKESDCHSEEDQEIFFENRKEATPNKKKKKEGEEEGGEEAMKKKRKERIKLFAALKSLNLSGHDIQTVGAKALAMVLPYFEGLAEVNLSQIQDSPFNWGMSIDAVEIIADALPKSLQRFYLANISLGPNGAKAFADVMKSWKPLHLTVLDLSWNKIGKVGIEALLDVVYSGKLSSLTELNLSNIDMLSEDNVIIVEMLDSGFLPNLAKLDLSDNSIGQSGALLGETLPKMKSLQVLNLRSCAFGDDEAIAILRGVYKNENFKHPEGGSKQVSVDLRGNDTSLVLVLNDPNILMDRAAGADNPEAFEATMEEMVSDGALRIRLFRGGARGEVASAIAKAVTTTKLSIKTIDLSYNEIGDEGATSLAMALVDNVGIMEVDLKGNNISDYGIETIANIIVSKRPKTRELFLDLSCNSIKKFYIPAERTRFDKVKQYIQKTVQESHCGMQVYETGDVYFGTLENHLPHGYGVIFYSDANSDGRSEYQGFWFRGVIQGKGTLFRNDGSVYEGMWYNGKQDGYGRQTLPDGSIYEGGWRKDMRHGKGSDTKLMCKFDPSPFMGHDHQRFDMECYLGRWVHGNRHGWGEEHRTSEREAESLTNSRYWYVRYSAGVLKQQRPNGALFERESAESESAFDEIYHMHFIKDKKLPCRLRWEDPKLKVTLV